ncbi:MAG: aminomethyl-transferring glycine dehydrogenase subunit GcvPA [Candidatus Wallbacteria bacterium]|nr:aminomethyl-transferring glycine dehydrogenase subunit GcvPA [Candidatus Wallbacteria bacterium]
MPYIPLTADDRKEMLREIGVKSVDELFSAIPEKIRLKKFDFLTGLTEQETLSLVQDLAIKNRKAAEAPCFMGAGAYDHYVPSAIDALTSRGEFYTAYTPYQPEVSQGTLQAIFEFQSLICSLTGMEVANASMYDGPTALAEAALLCTRQTGKKTVLYPDSLHPCYLEVLKTYLSCLEIVLHPVKSDKSGRIDLKDLAGKLIPDTACLLLQNPNFFGIVENGPEISAVVKDKALLIVSADPNSLGLLTAPGSYGAAACVGDCQPLGIPLSFGGPYAGFFAVDKTLMRKMPGRLVGKALDRDGKEGFVLTLQAREQHIKREKATSNICSNQALCALRATIYLSLAGAAGLAESAETSSGNAHYLAGKISKIPGFSLRYSGEFYKEFLIDCPKPAAEIFDELFSSHNLLCGVPLSRFKPEDRLGLLIAATEKRTVREMDALVQALSAFGEKK